MGHDELSKRYQVRVADVSFIYDNSVKMASKKQGTSASACNPIDIVSAAGTVRVQQNLIS